MIPHAGTARLPATTLHGRDREMGLVGDLLDRARRGRGGALTVLAGPGLGKSALLTAAAERAGDAFQTLDVRGVRAESGIPFAGLHRLLRPLTGQLAGRLPGGLTGGAGPLAVCAAVCEALGEAAALRPVLCLADDAHRMDRASLEALAFAARRLRGLPVAMLFAAGVPHPAAPPPGCLDDLPRIALEALDDEAALRVLEELVGRDLGADVAVELTELAGGCPLALAELAAALTPGQLSGTAPPPRTLPAHSALRARYQRRYLRLAPGARRLVLLACADDDGVPVEAFTRAARADGVDPGELEAARECGLVRVADGTVSASTPLVRSVLYTDAVPGERRAVHRLLAAALDGERDASRRVWHRAALVAGPDDPMAGELAGAARGADAAGRHGEAARSWQRAAALTADPGVRRDRLLAAARCAWTAGRPARARALLRQVEPDPAAGLLRGAIELGDGLPVIAVWTLLDTADRTAADPATALAALTLAGEAADVLGDAPYRAAIAERAAALAPADPAGRLAALHARAMAAAFRGRRREARAALREVLALAAEVDDPAYADVTALVLGDDHAARSLAARSVAAARRAGDATAESRALAVLAYAEVALGHHAAAASAARDGLRLARAAGHRNRAVELRALLGLLAAFRGDGAAHEYLAGVPEEAARRGLARAGALASWALACLDLAADRPADAAARLRTPTGAHPAVRTLATPHYVEAAVLSGQRAAARRAFAEFERWTGEAAPGPGHRAAAARCRALLAEDERVAAECFEEALRLHRGGGSAFESARTALLYGHRLRRARRPRDARVHLRDALRVFADLGARPWAERARSELRAAGGAAEAPGRGDPLAALTAQQRQIAALVAAGATNREIATHLMISTRTVDGHLRNIFTRLGLRSRVELARLAG